MMHDMTWFAWVIIAAIILIPIAAGLKKQADERRAAKQAAATEATLKSMAADQANDDARPEDAEVILGGKN